jgi:hypothetical protein
VAADDIFRFTVTVPAGVTQANPQVTLTQFRPAIVERITWRIPPGHAALTGFQISMRGVQVLPSVPGLFITGDDEQGAFEVQGQPDSGDWSVTAYNTGTVPHSFLVSFHVRTIRPQPSALTLFSSHDLGEIDGRYVLADG